MNQLPFYVPSSLPNRINLQCCITLPVTARALVLFAALLFEDHDLLVFTVSYNGGGDLTVA
jgi:hypothetical protein